MIKLFCALIRREFIISIRNLSSILNPLMFFIMVIVLFPLGISPDKHLLHQISPGIVWVAALLANMLSLERLFQQDYDDGMLELYLIYPAPLSWITLAKIVAHWLLTALPLIIVTPLLGVMLYMQANEISILMLSLLIGTPIISCLGAVGAAITVALSARGILLSVLILPLSIPVLILGAGAVVSCMSGMAAMPLLLLLTAMLIITLISTPFAAAAALKLGGGG